jgi:hypothetical protein
MPLTRDEIKELAQILDARAGLERRAKPKLRLITPPTPRLLDHIAREAHLKRILWLARSYRLEWLVDQATFGVASVTLLEDCDLIRLLLDMERARECIADGVSFEDADLVRNVTEPGTASRISRQLEAEADRASIAVERMVARLHKKSPAEPPF